ncbi:hypothetical protein OQ279_08250 [Salinimicrobium sp. MT39]|jgi:hypothetical protein|uniref:Uncharacterized protein n=1 Tax=Salinimicrobium profundisediminis TaxID=2994553 RepID=A0A9X3I0L8_9FLAO|nr:hypothetical protein [Salinimicrobium profundisediminis]MCX2838145.1 hypothetical protein [Salinimicrobium profundisediminis]
MKENIRVFVAKQVTHFPLEYYLSTPLEETAKELSVHPWQKHFENVKNVSR